MRSLGAGEVVTDKLKIPNLDLIFNIDRRGDEVRTDLVTLPLMTDVKVASRDELADAFLQCLAYRQNVLGLSWKVGDTSVLVTYSSQGSTELTVSEDTFRELMVNLLKARANMDNFNWEFGKPFIKVTYRLGSV